MLQNNVICRISIQCLCYGIDDDDELIMSHDDNANDDRDSVGKVISIYLFIYTAREPACIVFAIV